MRIADLTTAWITTALNDAGHPGVEVTEFEVSRVGTGQMAETYRIAPTYGSPSDAPGSVVLKLSPEDDQSRETARLQASYLREVNYYRLLAPTVGGRSPRVLHSEIDDSGTEFALLMEDLSPARVGDQVTGCTVAECAAAVDEIALVHGPRWNDPELFDMSWLNISGDFYPMAQAWQQRNWGVFLERYDDMLDPRSVAIGETLVPSMEAYHTALSKMPQTLQHGDFRPDNMLFDIRDGAEPAAIVDWQTLMLGPGALDVAYFIGGALSAEERRAHEEELFTRYYDSLADQGVDHSRPALWDDYRIGACSLFLVAMGASVNVARTERGDRMFMSMIQHATDQMTDLESLKALAAR